jgi:8-oxo-dGTP pyrophosphatase MutT (NUDIX family)
MLHLIPPPLHRLAYRLAHFLRLRWWRLRKPLLTGCRVLAFDPQGRVLLVRHSYGSGKWMPPGGGISRGEEPLSAGIRELQEETGCLLVDPSEFGLLEEPLHGTINRVHLITGSTSGEPKPDGREVIAAAFFSSHALPNEMTPSFASTLPGLITAARAVLRPG